MITELVMLTVLLGTAAFFSIRDQGKHEYRCLVCMGRVFEINDQP